MDRRHFLAGTAMTLMSADGLTALGNTGNRPRVAAIFTLFRHRTHAHVLLENHLEKYYFNGKKTNPGVDIVSFYADQKATSGDMTAAVAKQYKIPVFKTIRQALTLGGDKLAVDAVLSIGEHGNYPVNEFGQREYPRKRFFDNILSVMKESKRFVPLFNDKHLSYRYDWAKEMYDEAKKYGVPLMAGSSVPLAQRRPNLELPAGAEIEEAISIHGGPLESYDFHGLEVLQSMIESRKGGETGLKKVEFLEGDALWNAAKAGRWSTDLAHAAMRSEFGRRLPSLKEVRGEHKAKTHGILLTYKDGLKATVLRVGQRSTRWNFACRMKGEKRIRATAFYVGPWDNRNLFKALSHSIQTHFRNKQAPYPVERTLLVTGILESAMKARRAKKELSTPHLEWGYQPRDFKAMRENGASWKIITDDVPQPKGINPNGGK